MRNEVCNALVGNTIDNVASAVKGILKHLHETWSKKLTKTYSCASYTNREPKQTEHCMADMSAANDT